MNARVTMSLASYLTFGRRDVHACVSCGHLGAPRPKTIEAPSGIERQCAACRNYSAVPLGQAASEGWLTVVNDGRVQNDLQVRG